MKLLRDLHSGMDYSFKLLAVGIAIIMATWQLPGNAQNISTEQNPISLKGPDGRFTYIAQQADDDGDGILNGLELGGYTYSIQTGLEPWNGDTSVEYYITDPLKWSTDGDPYSDFMEVSGINMPAAISAPENHPLVAARPVISIKMSDYDVIPLATITNTSGGEQSGSFTNTVSNSNTVSASVTVGASLNPFELVSAEVTASYSHTWTNTQSSTSSFGNNWSNTRSTQPDQAAQLRLRIYMENLGGATALDVVPTINLSLGERTIATFIPGQTANILTPPGTADSRYPRTGTIVVEQDENANNIVITLDELKAIQRGTPLSLEVVQVSAQVVRWNTAEQDWNSDIDWASFESEIDPVSVDIRAELGDGTNRRYQVFAGTAYWDPGFTFKDITSLIFDVEEDFEGVRIEGRNYPENWYLSSPSPSVIDAWNDAGQPQSLLPLTMSRNTKIVMMSPGNDPDPIVHLASYTANYNHILVSALPNNFPILSVTAEVPVTGEIQTLELIQGENTFYSNEIAITGIPEGPGTVIVENARGDVTEASILLPAIYADAADVKAYSSFLPDPGSEYWIYPNGDDSNPMLLYCLFFDPETHDELPEPREYLSINEVAGPQVFSDYNAYGLLYRFHFDKVRINPHTLKMAIDDRTFSNVEFLVGEGDVPPYIEGQVGRLIWSYPEIDSGRAHIDLTGTPYHFAMNTPFTREAEQSIIIDETRKRLDIRHENLLTVAFNYYGYSGVESDSIQLLYGYDFNNLAEAPELSGSALQLNATGVDGYVDMGTSESLRLTDTFTLEAWVYPTDAGLDDPWGGMIMNREGEYELFRTTDGTIRWAVTNSTPGWNWQGTQFYSPENKWLHIAVVYDMTEIKTYFNGSLFHTQPGNGPIGDFYPSANSLWIGGRQNNAAQHFQGLIDEVRIWNTARTASQIAATIPDTLSSLYYATADSGLIGYWRFDEQEYLGDGVYTTRDYSVNGNNGQFVGDAQLTAVLPTGLDEKKELSPGAFELEQNYPNPFNPVTTITYRLPETAQVNLTIFNSMGQKIRTLVDSQRQRGTHALRWDGRNQSNQQVASGVFIYRLQVDGEIVQSRKMILIR